MAKKKKADQKPKPRYLTKALRCPDGTRKYIRGKTPEELDAKVRQAQAELGLGININDGITVAEFSRIWLDVYKRPSLKPQSVDVIITQLNTHILPVIGGLRVRDVRPADCARVLSHGGAAKNTQDMLRSRMKDLFECARENRVIADNPVTRSVKASGRGPSERTPLSREQLEEFCALSSQAGEDTRLFVMLCGYAGLRAGEALGLHLDNVDLDQGVIHVREQQLSGGGVTAALKTDSSRRDVPMPPPLLSVMAELKGTRRGYIFPVSDGGLASRMNSRIRALCSVGPDGEVRTTRRSSRQRAPYYVHPHLLRHTYATLCFEAGMDLKEVQYLMGHSTPDMTLSIYTHYAKERRLEDTSRKLAEAFPLS